MIKRAYEVDPLECPECGGAIKIISFIERRQTDVIQRVSSHRLRRASRETGGGKESLTQIPFDGEVFNALSVREWRKKMLGGTI